jgi:hypothetical protein
VSASAVDQLLAVLLCLCLWFSGFDPSEGWVLALADDRYWVCSMSRGSKRSPFRAQRSSTSNHVPFSCKMSTRLANQRDIWRQGPICSLLVNSSISPRIRLRVYESICFLRGVASLPRPQMTDRLWLKSL